MGWPESDTMWPFGWKLFLCLRFGAAFFSFFFFGSTAIVDFVNCEQCIRALFTVPQITLFSNFFIKNGFHSTIYTFKNYFATVFLVSVFSFSKNKLNPNTPNKKRVISGSTYVTRNKHVWHANLFESIRNDPLNTTRLTCITNKYLFYFRFVKYLLYPTYILNLKRKVSNYKNLQGI